VAPPPLDANKAASQEHEREQEQEQETVDWPPPGHAERLPEIRRREADRRKTLLGRLTPEAQAEADLLDLDSDYRALLEASLEKGTDAQVKRLQTYAMVVNGSIMPTSSAVSDETLSPDIMAEVERVSQILSGEIAVAQLPAWKRSPEEQAAMRAASTPVDAPRAPWTPGSESVLPVPTTPAAPASPLAPGQWAVATPQSDSAAKAPAKKKEFEPAGDRIVISTADPYYNAKDFVYRKHTVTGNPTLHYHRGGFYGWDGAAYQESTPQTVRTGLYEYLAECFSRDPEGKLHPVKPNKKMVDDHADALRASSHLDDATEAPAWLEHVPDLPADEMLSCQNGLLHLPTQCLVPHTPLFYTHNALPFSYEADPPEPVQW
jgi:hypothetical protein